MATVKEIIEKAYTKVNGEFEALIESSDDFRTYLNVMNQVLEGWAHTPYVKWQSLYNMDYTLPDQVVDGQLTYPVAQADQISVANTPFDSVYFVDNLGVVVGKFKMTGQAMYEASNATDICCLVSDGLHLKTTPSNIIGATIRLPAYVLPPVYATGSQTVRVDSVPWLVTAMSAFICDASPVPFIARNAEKFYKESAIYMKSMKDNNRHNQHLIIKSMANTNAPGSFFAALDSMTIRDL